MTEMRIRVASVCTSASLCVCVCACACVRACVRACERACMYEEREITKQ